jgi:hypothetical protein
MASEVTDKICMQPPHCQPDTLPGFFKVILERSEHISDTFQTLNELEVREYVLVLLQVYEAVHAIALIPPRHPVR